MFAACLLIMPLFLILLANPDVKLAAIQSKSLDSFGANNADGSSSSIAMYDWPIGVYDFNHLHPQPVPKWSLPLLAHHTLVEPSNPQANPNILNFTSPPLKVSHNQRIYPHVNTHVQKRYQLTQAGSPSPSGIEEHAIESEPKETHTVARVFGDSGTMISFSLDVSGVGCGCTAALYMVAMLDQHDENFQPGTCPEVSILRPNVLNV